MINYSVKVEADHPFYRSKRKNVVVSANSSDEAIRKYLEGCEFRNLRNKGYVPIDVLPCDLVEKEFLRRKNNG